MNKLEQFLNKNVTDWVQSDIQILLEELAKENEDIQNSLKDKSILLDVINNCKDQNVVNQFKPLLLSCDHFEAMQEADNIIAKFNEGEQEKTELIDIIEKRMNSNNLFKRFTAYLMAVSMFSDYEVKSYEEKIKEDTNSFKEIICSLNSYSEYTLLTDLFDEFFALRNYYYSKYQKDIMDDSDESVKKALDNYNSVTEAINHMMEDPEFQKLMESQGDNNG